MTIGHALGWVLLAGTCLTGSVPAAETSAAARGQEALLTRAYTPPAWSLAAYRHAWKRWGDRKEPPADYARAFQERYGLPPAPYPNGDYPMGLRESAGLLGKGLATDCLLCHGGSLLGQSIVGLGNASFDIQGLFEDLSAADGRPARTPFAFGNVRGTSEAGGIAVYLLGYREPDLRLRTRWLDLGVHDDLCGDAPAWWLLAKKRTMYHTGSGDARSVRSLMQFMLTPLNAASRLERDEAAFRDIQAYLLSLEAPRYPFPIDRTLAAHGATVFKEHCARCHGTYGPGGTYPNKIVPLEEIGTDRSRWAGITRAFDDYYNRSWFGRERTGWFADDYAARPSAGYQAPPLDGVWATAPYFHNGAVPTVYHVLNAKARPRIFTRSYRTGAEDYDPERLGWKVTVLEQGPDPGLSGYERRKIYDTTQPGRGNGGHTYGDDLEESERRAVLEYLKTL